ncbi:hypothetical protein BDF14DRAFT_612176 [Spinellus fusiger]|nr:hypothetical protein BDF14DRAFT_612176 [Spinellus fusiger]
MKESSQPKAIHILRPMGITRSPSVHSQPTQPSTLPPSYALHGGSTLSLPSSSITMTRKPKIAAKIHEASKPTINIYHPPRPHPTHNPTYTHKPSCGVEQPPRPHPSLPLKEARPQIELYKPIKRRTSSHNLRIEPTLTTPPIVQLTTTAAAAAIAATTAPPPPPPLTATTAPTPPLTTTAPPPPAAPPTTTTAPLLPLFPSPQRTGSSHRSVLGPITVSVTSMPSVPSMPSITAPGGVMDRYHGERKLSMDTAAHDEQKRAWRRKSEEESVDSNSDYEQDSDYTQDKDDDDDDNDNDDDEYSPPQTATVAAHAFANTREDDDSVDDEEEEEPVMSEARVNRKIADLEISNQSLLAVNAMLEATVKRQALQVTQLKKQMQLGQGTGLGMGQDVGCVMEPVLQETTSGRRTRSSSACAI